MKKIFILLVLLGVMPLSLMAQDDDLYFTPKKTVETNSSSQIKVKEKASYYCGSNRDVDEYNRRGKFSSYCQKIGSDSLGNDIIEFHAGNELYPDSSYVDTAYIYPGSMQYQVDDNDYYNCRRMSRFDGYYGWYDPWMYGYYGYSPYYCGRWGWSEPWCYSGYYGWYDPWYYGYDYGYPYRYYGWDYPYYGGWGGDYISHNVPRGGHRQNFGGSTGINGGRVSSWANSGVHGRSFGSSGTSRFGTSPNGTRSYGSSNSVSMPRSSFSRSNNNSTYSNSRSYTPSNSNSGNSFSGGQSSFGSGGGGGFSSGGHSSGGGGGHFGGHR